MRLFAFGNVVKDDKQNKYIQFLFISLFDQCYYWVIVVSLIGGGPSLGDNNIIW